MSKIMLDSNPNFTTDVEVRESDEYTQTVLLRLAQGDRKLGEVYLIDVNQLDGLGRFLISEAQRIRAQQEARNLKE